MTNENVKRSAGSSDAPATSVPPETPARALKPEAQRALAEAEERRRATLDSAATDRPRELHGRGGAEPVRFGDWEIKGLAVDF